MTKKHNQYILAMDTEAYGQNVVGERILLVHNEDYVFHDERNNDYLVVRQRNRLENLEQYRQVLPYIVLRKWNDETKEYTYYPYRREQKVGESRLAGNVSFGYGGHIDAPDIQWNENGSINLRETIVEAARRELDEEVVFLDSGDNDKRVFIEFSNVIVSGLILQNTDSTDGKVPVGNVHAAYVIFQDVFPGMTVQSGEDELTSMPPMTAKELLESGLPLEDWTRIILQYEDKFIESHLRILAQEFGEVSVDADTVVWKEVERVPDLLAG